MNQRARRQPTDRLYTAIERKGRGTCLWWPLASATKTFCPETNTYWSDSARWEHWQATRSTGPRSGALSAFVAPCSIRPTGCDFTSDGKIKCLGALALRALVSTRYPATVPNIPPGKSRSQLTQGEMAEWLKAHAWKACLGETLTWVRIPLSPPESCKARRFRRLQSMIGGHAPAAQRTGRYSSTSPRLMRRASSTRRIVAESSIPNRFTSRRRSINLI